MRFSRSALVHCATAFVIVLLVAPAAQGTWGRLLPTGPPPPPASMNMVLSRKHPGSDTLSLGPAIHFASPCTQWQGQWSVTLPEKMVLVDGLLHGSGLTDEIRGLHEARVRCSQWGNFTIRASFRTGIDSLNWTSHECLVDLRVTPDSFEYRVVAPSLNKHHVLGGIHHRSTGWVWLPLDPGESEEVEPGFDERNHKSPPPALHKASGAVAGATDQDSVVSMPVLVAVGRDGTVKDVYTHIRGVHNAVLEAAVQVARKWTFTPAKSFGQPASALYEIRVPVHAPLAIARKHRF